MLSPKIGGRLSRKQREKKEARDIGFYAYKNAKTLAAERGKDISKAINMGLPENRILSKLGLDYKPIKNISINAHGAIGEGLKPAFIKVPKNIVIMYLGEIGRKSTVEDPETFICNDTPPRQIALPGEKVPNVELSSSRHNEDFGDIDEWESGIYECIDDNPVNKLKITEDLLTPFEEQITFLSVVLPKISKAIGNQHWGFVKLNSCLGFCDLYYSKENLDKFTLGIDTHLMGWNREVSHNDVGLTSIDFDDVTLQLNFHPTTNKDLHNLIYELFYASIGVHSFYDKEKREENIRKMVNLTAKFIRTYPQVNYKGNTVTVYEDLPNKAGTFMQNHVHFTQAINDGNQAAISYLWSKVFNGKENEALVLPLCEYIYYARAGGNHALARWMQDLELKKIGSTVEEVADLLVKSKYSVNIFGVYDARYDHPDSKYWKQNRQQTGGFSLINRPSPPMKGGFFICY